MPDSSRVRVSIIGVVCVALFSALFARLWFLQMASADTFVEVAQANSTRVIQTESPRGKILDRNGNVLVENSTLTAVMVDRAVPEDELEVALGRLAELFGASGVTTDGKPVDLDLLRARYADERASRFKPAIVAVDQPPRDVIPPDVIVTLAEREEEFPHVTVAEVPVRQYPDGTLAAHLLGYTGEISPEQLLELKKYEAGDTVGRSGAEAAYERDLRGVPRRETIEVDPANERVSDEPLDVEEGRPGNNVVLTIDEDVQQVAEEALADAMAQNRELQNPDVDEYYEEFASPAGAVVVLDVTDGSVVAMASNPTYDPALFIGGIQQQAFDALMSEEMHEPLNNRATQGVYAVGSTFKLITSLAALEQGIRTPTTPYNDTGALEIEGTDFRNAGGRVYGIVDLPTALTVSVDTYFYEIGRVLWQCFNSQETCAQDGDAIQHVARRFGFGDKTGIPLPEEQGRVPDETWRREYAEVNYTDEAECARISAEFGSPEPLSCEDLREQAGIWRPGDNINLAVGQGDVGVTPLQLANAYAAFANGGTLWKPRIAARIEDLDGKTVRNIRPRKIRDIPIDPTAYTAIMSGLVGAVTSEEGTAGAAFAGFPHRLLPIAGKTGTAQVNGKADTSLFAGIVPSNAPKYVVVAVVEEAGFGSRVAAPIARQVIEALYDLPHSDLVVPEQQDSGVRD